MGETRIEHAGDKKPADPLTQNTPSGIATSLQPGGTVPGKSPAASVGSIGTGGGQTANAPSGAAKNPT